MRSRTPFAVILGRTTTHSASRVIFIQNRQHFVTAPIAKFVMNAVDGPDMVGVCGPQPDDRTVLMDKAACASYAGGEVAGLLRSISVYLLMVNPPTFHVVKAR